MEKDAGHWADSGTGCCADHGGEPTRPLPGTLETPEGVRKVACVWMKGPFQCPAWQSKAATLIREDLASSAMRGREGAPIITGTKKKRTDTLGRRAHSTSIHIGNRRPFPEWWGNQREASMPNAQYTLHATGAAIPKVCRNWRTLPKHV